MVAVRLTLLDGFALSCDDATVLVSKTSQRLLAILGLQTGTTRSHIAGLLWPETPEERAVACLRTALWRLRKQPAPLVRARGESVGLHEQVQVDVVDLMRSARLVQAGDGSPETAALLTAGPGELLPGWYDDWVLVERERLRQLRLQTLEALARRHLQGHRYGAALEAAMAAMRAEMLRETPHRLVVEAHLAQGNTAEALTAYRRYRDLLSHELHLAPSAALQRFMRDALAPLALPHTAPRSAPPMEEAGHASR